MTTLNCSNKSFSETKGAKDYSVYMCDPQKMVPASQYQRGVTKLHSFCMLKGHFGNLVYLNMFIKLLCCEYFSYVFLKAVNSEES